MGIWVAGTSNQLYIRASYTETKFPKNNVVSGKTPLFMISPLYTLHSTSLNIGF